MVGARQPRWKARPVISLAVRATALLLPLGASIAVAILVARLLPSPRGLGQTVLWWVAFLSAAVAVLAVVDRVARRLLPLAALFSLSLVFPARVPNRFRTALRAGSTRELNLRINQARSRGLEDEPARAAETILVLVAALAKHDRVTRGHSERVRALTDLLAAEMNLSEADCDLLRWSALLHDIGKIDIDAALLNKPGVPAPDEWNSIREHPDAGARLAAPLAAWLGPWFGAIADHHERYDGRGYPNRLWGENISQAGRIVAVADAYETMTAGRPYKRPMPVRVARRELAVEAGAHFDPLVVRAFLNLSIGRLWRLTGIGAWIASLAVLPRPIAALTESARGAATATAFATAAALGAGLVDPSVTPVVLGNRLQRPPAAIVPAPGNVGNDIVPPPALPDERTTPPPTPRTPTKRRPSSQPLEPRPRSSPTPSPTIAPSPDPEPTCLDLVRALIQDVPGSVSVDRVSAVVDCLVAGGPLLALR